MNHAVTTHNDAPEKPVSMIDRWARFLLFKMVAKIQFGRITITDGGTCQTFGSDADISAHVTVLNPQFYRKVIIGGSIGAGEAYIEKHWDVDDLTALVRIMVRNMDVLDKIERGIARVVFPVHLFKHKLKRNSRKKARQNILSHYDLGNDLYQSFLDPTMMYSSAMFTEEHTTLESAAINKLETICRKLDLQPTDKVIEIGSGWCGFAIYAAQNYGCHVTTTTISRAQYLEGKRRIFETGLADKITLLQKDYRDLTGKFDKLVSIEMIEAVGHAYHEAFFKTCANLLKKDGKMLIQAITIADQKYDRYIGSVDFLQRYIFPGGCLPSVKRMVTVLADHTDMAVRGLEDFGDAYARTLNVWRQRFNRAFFALRDKGYDERFKRLWNFYLSYCEGGFKERTIGVVHLVASRPQYQFK